LKKFSAKTLGTKFSSVLNLVKKELNFSLGRGWSYDHCVVNKEQCTMVWSVNDLNDAVVGGVLELIKEEFGKDLDVTFTRGKVHDYHLTV
jgi:hypothetical protein